MIKVFIVIAAWIIGTGLAALATDKNDNVEGVAYAYTIGFAIALGLGLWLGH